MAGDGDGDGRRRPRSLVAAKKKERGATDEHAQSLITTRSY
jgi:hypothetical protein